MDSSENYFMPPPHGIWAIDIDVVTAGQSRTVHDT